ncbi:MAG: penicillin-insensitive murein endopeptidase [Pseudomonadota bacterium]
MGLFSAAQAPADGDPVAYGTYSRGCIGGAVALPESGPSWQAMRPSRNRNWGHPDTVLFVRRLARAAVEAGWPGIYVGDISQPRGGPATLHRSHQMGLDVDIWMRRPERLDLSRAEREQISFVSVRTDDQRSVNANWTPAHQRILRAAAEDPAVARIFVAAAVKQEMCRAAEGDRAWLRKIRPWWGHDGHFHVRLNCPADSPDCVEQSPPPPGDGCDASLAWWTSDAALNPQPDPNAPAPQPRRELTLADLPAECRAVLAR